MKTCAIENCGIKRKVKLYCRKHYERLKRTGDPTMMLNAAGLSLKQHIIKNIKKVKCPNLESIKFHNEKDLYCWEWQKGRDREAYGSIKRDRKTYRTHRKSYEVFIGEIPKGIQVNHKCDNKICCNPNHLFIGTHKDNMKDRNNKNRTAKGEDNGRAKLTENEVINIRKLWKSTRYTQKELSARFNVSAMNVCTIVNNKTWKHIC